MSASAYIQEVYAGLGASNRYTREASHYHQSSRGSDTNAVVKELSEALKRTMTHISALLGVHSCWIDGLDTNGKTLIPMASLPSASSGQHRTRLILHEDVASWVAANATPALIADVSSDPHFYKRGPLLVGSILSVPLLSGQQLLGVITVSSPAPGAFNQQSIKILQVLAEHVVLAIARARQTGAALQQTQQLTAMIQVARAMTSALEALQISQALVAAIRQMVWCEEAVIFSYREAMQKLQAIARLGTHSTQLGELCIPLSDKQSVAAWVAQQRRPLLQAPGGRFFVGRVTEALLGEDDLALLGAPLFSTGHLQGVVLLARSTPFDTGELRAMLNLSTLLAAALERLTPAL